MTFFPLKFIKTISAQQFNNILHRKLINALHLIQTYAFQHPTNNEAEIEVEFRLKDEDLFMEGDQSREISEKEEEKFLHY